MCFRTRSVWKSGRSRCGWRTRRRTSCSRRWPKRPARFTARTPRRRLRRRVTTTTNRVPAWTAAPTAIRRFVHPKSVCVCWGRARAGKVLCCRWDNSFADASNNKKKNEKMRIEFRLYLCLYFSPSVSSGWTCSELWWRWECLLVVPNLF